MLCFCGIRTDARKSKKFCHLHTGVHSASMKTTNEYIVSAKRLNAMTMSAEPSELTIYKSEHLTDFERRFFVDNIVVKSIEFSGSANAQIFCRCMIHDRDKGIGGQALASSFSPGKETILCLHGFQKMTTSWTWLKFSTTLFRSGFNVIMLDLPGFGRSSIMRDIRCPVSTWEHWQVQMFTTFLGQMGISRVNVMGCYQGASLFLDILLHAPQVLSGNHFLHNVCARYLTGMYISVASLFRQPAQGPPILRHPQVLA